MNGNPGYNSYPQAPPPLVAPAARGPQSQIPTEQLMNQADRWVGMQGQANPGPGQMNVHRDPRMTSPSPGPRSNMNSYPPGPEYRQNSYGPYPMQYVQPGYGNPSPQQNPQGYPGYQSPPPMQQGYYPGQPGPVNQALQMPSSNTMPRPNSVLPPLSSFDPSAYRPLTRKEDYYPNPKEAPPNKLAVTLPEREILSKMKEQIMISGGDMTKKVAWAKQVLKYVERFQNSAGEASRISDPQLVQWTDDALSYILSSANSTVPVALALYLRGDLSSTGSFPSYRPKDVKAAFRDFEAAANMGYEKAWFKIGRAYEDFGDTRRAVAAYERGVERGDCGSTYRLSMAFLLGQIGLQADHEKAVALLRRAADTADLDVPQPPYIFGMLLSGEFENPSVQLPKNLVPVNIEEARWRIERSAFLCFGPAQYKMGFSHEYATLGSDFDPLLSVQYYALASQNGEVEADMALSKWYLCGSPGHLDKDEKLAVVFAEKAASRQLPAAEFALGYYREVGINGVINLQQAKMWYQRAANHGNQDAQTRLTQLQASEQSQLPNTLNRVDHEAHMGMKLVDARAQAERQSQVAQERRKEQNLVDMIGGGAASQTPMPTQSQIFRQNTRRAVEMAAKQSARPSPMQTVPSQYKATNPPPQQQFAQQQQYGQNLRPQTQQQMQRPGLQNSQSTATFNSQSSGSTSASKQSTFADLGIATAPAKKDDCVVM